MPSAQSTFNKCHPGLAWFSLVISSWARSFCFQNSVCSSLAAWGQQEYSSLPLQRELVSIFLFLLWLPPAAPLHLPQLCPPDQAPSIPPPSSMAWHTVGAGKLGEWLSSCSGSTQICADYHRASSEPVRQRPPRGRSSPAHPPRGEPKLGSYSSHVHLCNFLVGLKGTRI